MELCGLIRGSFDGLEAIESGRHLGRALIEHDVLREIQLWVVQVNW